MSYFPIIVPLYWLCLFSHILIGGNVLRHKLYIDSSDLHCSVEKQLKVPYPLQLITGPNNANMKHHRGRHFPKSLYASIQGLLEMVTSVCLPCEYSSSLPHYFLMPFSFLSPFFIILFLFLYLHLAFSFLLLFLFFPFMHVLNLLYGFYH